MLTASRLRCYKLEQGQWLNTPTESLATESLVGARILTDDEIGPTVDRAAPLSCVLAPEMPEPTHTVVHVRTDASRRSSSARDD